MMDTSGNPATVGQLRRLARCLLLAGTVFSGLPAAAHSQAGLLTGRLVDSSGAPVPNADVVLAAGSRTATVDINGRFAFKDVSTGYHTVLARAIGYGFTSARVFVPPNDSGHVEIRMQASPRWLSPLEVTVSADAALLPDFARRRRAGFGYFVSRAELEAAGPITLSQYLRRIPVIRIRESLGLAQAVSSRGPRTALVGGAVVSVPCVMRIALDGQLQPEEVGLDLVSPIEIGGVEIYPGPSTIPAEFAAWSNEIGCGLIMVWTRRR
jgi:hypothetical protein